jgi:ribonuclease E
MDSVPLAADEEVADEDVEEEVEAEGGEDRRPGGRDATGEDAEAQRRRRRRRRGRGRGGDRDGQFLPADAPQPPDDGLAYVAASTAPELGQGELVEPPAEAAEGAPVDRGDHPRERRPRRGGRGRRFGQAGEPGEQFDRGPGYWAYSEGTAEVAEAEGGIAPAPEASPEPVAEAPQPPQSAPASPNNAEATAPLVSATTASIGGVQGAAETETPPPPRRTPASPPEHVLANQKVITQADPDRPKRGGWWQRAKATLTGGE